jgi:tetratricopeptide (TPR) repeat protein
MHAVALRQQAYAYALLGDDDSCGDALDSALSLSERGADSEDDLANYCTTEYIEMEAAHCWIELGKPDQAVPTLQHGLARWQPEYRRDLGLCLARLGVAHAACDQVEYALAVADQALQVATETHSFRIETQLGRISDLISKAGAIDEARQFDRRIKALRREDKH